MNGWQRIGIGVGLAVLCLSSRWWHASDVERISDNRKVEDRRANETWYQTYRNCRDTAHDLSRDLEQSRDCAREAFAAARLRP
jgi:hypothetical protein